MTYPTVNRTHIVPRCYLEQFAVDGMIEMHLVGRAGSSVISTRHAAVRNAAYRRTRPSGAKIDDVEWSLSQVEGKAAPLLRTLRETWPLALEDKAILANLFALQLVRGPRWKEWHEDFARRIVDEHRPADETSHDAATTRIELDALQQHLLGDTPRLTKMLQVGIKATAVFTSMHWSRIDFARPVLATSDHPIVPWPIDESARRPEPTRLDIGVLGTLEVRVPVSPFSAILMTWADELDRDRTVIRGNRDHAANLNAFTIAHAERQWFHLPDHTPPVAVGGRLVSLSPQLVAGYGLATAAKSRRRSLCSENVQPMIGDESFSREIKVVSFT